MLILITGKPCVGKTTFLNLFKEDGFECFNVDNFVNEIYQFNQIGYILIQANFGKQYVNNTSVDKQKLLDLITNDYEKYLKLCNLIWPLIKSELIKFKKTNKFVIVEMSIYLLNREYFKGIFDNVFLIKRDINQNALSPNQFKMLSFFKNTQTETNDYVIENNLDVIQIYFKFKEIVKLLFSRFSNQTISKSPSKDGFVLNKYKTKYFILIWPSIFNNQKLSNILNVEKCFFELIKLLSQFTKISLGCDLCSYKKWESLKAKNTTFLITKLTPIDINKNLLVFLENPTNYETRYITSTFGKNEINDHLFATKFKKYVLNYNLDDNSFFVYENTIFILKSKLENIIQTNNLNKEDFVIYLKHFFITDDLLEIDDTNASKFNCIYDYVNFYDNYLFISEDNLDTKCFLNNKDLLLIWAKNKKINVITLPVIYFNKNAWLSYTNFISIDNEIITFNLEQSMSKEVKNKFSRILKHINLHWIDKAIFDVAFYFGINFLIKKIPLIPF